MFFYNLQNSLCLFSPISKTKASIYFPNLLMNCAKIAVYCSQGFYYHCFPTNAVTCLTLAVHSCIGSRFHYAFQQNFFFGSLSNILIKLPAGMAPMFLNSFQGYHVRGGIPLCQQCSDTQCQHDCLHNPACAAADYNSMEAVCYGHRGDTACGVLVPKTGCTHFRRVQCE